MLSHFSSNILHSALTSCIDTENPIEVAKRKGSELIWLGWGYGFEAFCGVGDSLLVDVVQEAEFPESHDPENGVAV